MEILYKKMWAINKLESRKMLIGTYQETRSIKKTAYLWATSRNVVRKWVRRWQEKGEEGLLDLSRKPKNSPNQVAREIEEKVIRIRKQTNYGKRRIGYLLWKREQIRVSESTVGKILRRNNLTRNKKRRKVFYPAIWAYDQDKPFSLAQVDTKDIYDKGSLGTAIYTHLWRNKLPRYQWTFLEGKSRLRFLCYSQQLHQTNGLAFVILVMNWLRAYGIKEEVLWQEDWGQEFGGDNPEKLAKLDRIYYQPLGARLRRCPKGRKGYQGRVERSHGIDDEEFYLPYLREIRDEQQFLNFASKWIYWYNTDRPHFGDKMNGKTPYEKLKESGYNLPIKFCAFPPILLDKISSNLVLNFPKRGGNDLCDYDIECQNNSK
jgi:transposase